MQTTLDALAHEAFPPANLVRSWNPADPVVTVPGAVEPHLSAATPRIPPTAVNDQGVAVKIGSALPPEANCVCTSIVPESVHTCFCRYCYQFAQFNTSDFDRC